MKKAVIANARETNRVLKAEIRRTQQGRFQHRLHCVMLVCAGKSCREVASLFGDSTRTVQYWIKRYNENGINGLRYPGHFGHNDRFPQTISNQQ